MLNFSFSAFHEIQFQGQFHETLNTEVNRRLVLMCKQSNISFFSYDESIDPSKHLNESKLHLNSNGMKIFAENFSRFLVKLN